MRRDPSSVLVTVPCRGTVGAETAMRLQAIRDMHPGLPPVLFSPGHLGSFAARNKVTAVFMAGDWEVLVMVDDDTVPSLGFLDVCDSLPEYAMVGEPYLLALRPEAYWGSSKPIPSQAGSRLVYCAFDPDPDGLPISPTLSIAVAEERFGEGVRQCAAVFTGAVAVTRQALLAVTQEAVERGEGWNPWRWTYVGGQQVGEDLTFCADLHRLGLKVGVSWQGRADHQTVTSLEAVRAAL